jgi:hypothetical protein
MVALHSLGIRGRNTAAAAAALSSPLPARLLVLLWGDWWCSGTIALGAVVLLGSLAIAATVVSGLNNVDHVVAALGVLRKGVVGLGGIGELGDNVPGVQEARDEAETAEEEINERVGRAETRLDPDWWGLAVLLMVG